MNAAQEREFEQFVLGSGRRLLRTARLLTGDLGAAEDLLQTAFERTARHWTRLEGPPEAYTRTVLARLATDRWRRARSRVSESFTQPPDQTAVDIAGQVVLQQALIAAMRMLSPRQRVVLVLRYFEDMDEEQTAQAMDVSRGTVKTTASRALARLRELVPELNPTCSAREAIE